MVVLQQAKALGTLWLIQIWINQKVLCRAVIWSSRLFRVEIEVVQENAKDQMGKYLFWLRNSYFTKSCSLMIRNLKYFNHIPIHQI